jgi:hypothetical protein
VSEHRRLGPKGGRAALILGIAIMALAACGSGAGVRPTPSPSGVTTARPASLFQVLVVQTVTSAGAQASTAVLLYDSASGQTRQLSQTGTDARFAPGGRISVGGPGTIQTVDAHGGAPRTDVDVAPLLIGTHAWSASGALAYVTEATPDHHLSDRLVVRPAGGVSSQVDLTTIAGGEGYQQPVLRFSPAGNLLLLVDPALQVNVGAAPDQTTVQVRRLDGSFAFGPPGAAQPGAPDAATWGGDGRLYFWDSRGVNVADLNRGTTRTILPGVRWYHPDTSPDGRYIVFELRDEQGVPTLHLLSTSTEQMVEGLARAEAGLARFVSPTLIWFHDEQPCSRCKGPIEVRQPILGYDIAGDVEAPTGLSGLVTDVHA